MLEADHELIEKEKMRYINIKRFVDNKEKVDYEVSELDEELDQIKFVDDKSSASFHVNDILGFTFGALSSRFWMLRKHINSMPINQQHRIPFYSWECISL